MNRPFKPTHELFDEDGESRGQYRKLALSFVDELTWEFGGRGVRAEEVRLWGWTAKPLEVKP